MSIGSPARISTLLAVYFGGDMPNASEFYTDTLKEFERMGVIKEANEAISGYVTTPLGTAWVRALENTPLPESVFIDQCGNILKP